MQAFVVVKILYCAASIQGIFLGVLLLRSRNNHKPNQVLSVLLFLLSFHLILVAFNEREFFITFPHLSRISWIIGSLYWPLLFLFVQSLTGYWLSRHINFLLFLPFVILLLVMMPYYIQSTDEKRNILADFERASRDDFGWINRTVSILHIFFQGLCLWFYHQIERKVKEEYSASENVRVHWLRQFLTGTLVVTVLAVLSFFAKDFGIPIISTFYNFHFIGVVILFYWLSYQALTKPVVFGFHQLSAPLAGAQPHHSTPPARLDESFNRIQRILEADKLYKRPGLTLTELADSAGLARHIASEAINVKSKGNFFDLINDLRLEEFKRLVNDPSTRHLTILGIAQEAGFNSKASFYAIFKKKTGMTPSEYVDQQRPKP